MVIALTKSFRHAVQVKSLFLITMKEDAVKMLKVSSVTIMSVYKKVRNVMELINVVINLMRFLCLVALVHLISMITRDAVNHLKDSFVIMNGAFISMYSVMVLPIVWMHLMRFLRPAVLMMLILLIMMKRDVVKTLGNSSVIMKSVCQ